MADYDIMAYDTELFQEKNDVTDLHAYYMSQFNLEVENCKAKPKTDSFKYGVEESFDFEVIENWNTTENVRNDLENTNEVVEYNISEQNIKDVLLDLDSIEFDDSSFKSDSCDGKNNSDTNFESPPDYIDDESLIDELCREDGESCLTPEFNEDFLKITSNEASLPSIETAFSKRYCNYNNKEFTVQQDFQIQSTVVPTNNAPVVSSIEQYSYPNNILYNLDAEKNYILPDTPTSCTEFNFERHERKISVCDSIESDVQSNCYYDDNSENFDEDDLFINLDDFGLQFDKDESSNDNVRTHFQHKKPEKDKTQGERVCLWELCYERYPNQNTLVEHIERAHVNTYKGDEFSCLWKDCARGRRPFNARYKLLIHMRVHSGHKPNRCHHPGCGKAFSRLENLKIHVRSHTGERPYACPAPHCRKAFSNSSDRAKHQRTHFNARPYACGAVGCGKRYTDPSSLRKHVKSHPHINVPRTCIPPSRPIRRVEEQLVPSSPAKLATLRCIRDKIAVPRLQKM
ncbi:transcriptional activator cubitus interruptus-like [Aricia agestis]|uniref:transcriptional activator cubitus interruptus-like n=1 Tax=Aricia agestis TaxID=91739 RepID=UPI001C20BDD3|nr:transcriptional activator cubitus interruptus-like [Aricia agestis]